MEEKIQLGYLDKEINPDDPYSNPYAGYSGPLTTPEINVVVSEVTETKNWAVNGKSIDQKENF